MAGNDATSRIPEGDPATGEGGGREVQQLLQVCHELYPVIAGQCIAHGMAGEVEAEKRWDGHARQLLAAVEAVAGTGWARPYAVRCGVCGTLDDVRLMQRIELAPEGAWMGNHVSPEMGEIPGRCLDCDYSKYCLRRRSWWCYAAHMLFSEKQLKSGPPPEWCPRMERK